jgi:FkbM family methyltransferase
MYIDNDIWTARYYPDCELLKEAYLVKHEIDRNFFYGKRSEVFTEKFIECCNGARTFIDVGAECGYYTYLALKNLNFGNCSGEGIAIEPHLQRYNTLMHVFGANPNLNVINKCVFENYGEIKLYQKGWRSPTIDKSSIEVCSNDIHISEVSKTINATTIPLDSFLNEQNSIDIIKMDIEGAEIFAFRGMENIFRRRKTRIFLEIHRKYIDALMPHGINEMENTLNRYNYSIYECNGLFLKKREYLSRNNAEFRFYLVPQGIEP